MNKLMIIGNLTRDPELRTTATGNHVCSFGVAVNRRKQRNGKQEVDYFRVNAWNALGENCHKFLAKGRKVAVVGAVSVSTYLAKDGSESRASLDVMASEVEFLSPQEVASSRQADTGYGDDTGYTPVDDDDLPF